jgi:uncharacterized delta-60 repeat protein
MVCSVKFQVLILLLFLATSAFAVTQDWVARYNGPANGFDETYSLVIDSSGNVYVVGVSAGVGTSTDFATIKYNSSGDQQWVTRYNGPGNDQDYPSKIAIDGSGNVYVTGASTGSGTGNDIATIKYNSTGDQQWVARYNNASDSDAGRDLIVDSSGNVFVTGSSYGSTSSSDYVTIKYNSSGDQQWVARYNGPANNYDVANAFAIDGAGNIYVTGISAGVGTGNDYATVKYNSSGSQQWVVRYDGTDSDWDDARALILDGSGNIYITGVSVDAVTSGDCVTIKYNSTGGQQWIARYDNSSGGDEGDVIAVDGSGNIYVAGASVGSGTGSDYVTIKYNSSGDQQWLSRYNGDANDWDAAKALAFDGSGNIYITGTSTGSGTTYDFATIKYDPSGGEQWVVRYNGPDNGQDEGRSIAVDDSDNVYVTGRSPGVGTSVDFATIKYSQPDTTPPTVSSLSPTSAVEGTTVEFSANATDDVNVTGCNFYWGNASQGAMTSAGGNVWVFNHTVGEANAYNAWANCTDAAGNTARNETNITVIAGEIGTTYSAPEADLFLVTALFCLAVLILGARRTLT